MSEYRQDDLANVGYCPVCAKPLAALTVAAQGYCDEHGWQWAEWDKPRLAPDPEFLRACERYYGAQPGWLCHD